LLLSRALGEYTENLLSLVSALPKCDTTVVYTRLRLLKVTVYHIIDA